MRAFFTCRMISLEPDRVRVPRPDPFYLKKSAVDLTRPDKICARLRTSLDATRLDLRSFESLLSRPAGRVMHDPWKPLNIICGASVSEAWDHPRERVIFPGFLRFTLAFGAFCWPVFSERV